MSMPTVDHCLITGAASGIGRALALNLLAAGWAVTGVDRVATSAADFGKRYSGHAADLSDARSCRELCADVLSGPALKAGLTALVHCAGIMRTGGIGDTDPGDAELLWRIHVEAPIILMKAFATLLPDERGRVVLVSSRAVLGAAHRSAYAASKAAQIGLARSWAAESISRGVTVNVVAPGAVDTPMLSDPARGAAPRVSLPLGRLIRADEVAATIAFLIGPQAGAITGQTLYVCGGASLGSPAV